MKDMMHKNINLELYVLLYKTGLMFRKKAIEIINNNFLTPEQWQIMSLLKCYGPMTQKKIGIKTVQNAASLCRTIKRMKKNGFVKIRKTAKDKRTTLICLTAKGKTLLTYTKKHTQKHINNFLKEYSNVKKRKILKLLKELRNCFLQ